MCINKVLKIDSIVTFLQTDEKSFIDKISASGVFLKPFIQYNTKQTEYYILTPSWV